jgi:hypothetical protein
MVVFLLNYGNNVNLTGMSSSGTGFKYLGNCLQVPQLWPGPNVFIQYGACTFGVATAQTITFVFSAATGGTPGCANTQYKTSLANPNWQVLPIPASYIQNDNVTAVSKQTVGPNIVPLPMVNSFLWVDFESTPGTGTYTTVNPLSWATYDTTNGSIYGDIPDTGAGPFLAQSGMQSTITQQWFLPPMLFQPITFPPFRPTVACAPVGAGMM